ncbi:unnamed protein product [Orchesella dallaii]|uniref:Prion-like-(Q/N-rich) domain-bearing protein 25 n=1 Tax=Orchesella dallaii TaxID=48710 RepID=A0ABP1RF33_9HEXA
MKFRVLFSVALALYGVVITAALSQDAGLVKTNSTVNKPCEQHSDCNSHYNNDRLNKTALEYCVQNKCRCGVATVFENETCLMLVGSPCGADFPSCERNSECRPWLRGLIQRCNCINGFFQNADNKCVHGFQETCKIDADCDFFNQKLKCSCGICGCASDQIYDKDSKQCKAKLRGVCQTGSDERNVLRCLDGLACISERRKCTMQLTKEVKCMEEMRCLGEIGTACTLLQDTCVPGTFCEADDEGSVFGTCTNVFAELWKTLEIVGIAILVVLVAFGALDIWVNVMNAELCCLPLPKSKETELEPKPDTPAQRHLQQLKSEEVCSSRRHFVLFYFTKSQNM